MPQSWDRLCLAEARIGAVVDITYRKPPRHGDGLVVWPSFNKDGYRITSVADYWKLVNPNRAPVRKRPSKLDAVVDAACDQAERDGLSAIYVIED